MPDKETPLVHSHFARTNRQVSRAEMETERRDQSVSCMEAWGLPEKCEMVWRLCAENYSEENVVLK
jgi:hypothetical protein